MQQLGDMRAADCLRAVEAVRQGADVRLNAPDNVNSPPIIHAMCVEASPLFQLQTAGLAAVLQ